MLEILVMPAETNHRRAPIDVEEVVDLFEALLGDPSEGALHADVLLADLGLDEIAVLHLWGAAAEELAERGTAEPDVEDLLLATTVGELADAVVRSLSRRERPHLTGAMTEHQERMTA
jgi:hypothetical protein